MTIELRLVKDDKVLLRVPILPSDDETRELEEDIDEEDVSRLSNLYSIAGNARRLRVMYELARRREMSFSDLLEIALNPKLVRDCMQPMVREGVVIHERRRAPYKPSEKGFAYVTLTTGLSRILELLDEEMESDEDE